MSSPFSIVTKLYIENENWKEIPFQIIGKPKYFVSNLGRYKNNKGEIKNQLAMGAGDEKCEGGKVMAMGIRVAGDKEGEGDEAGDGVGSKGGVRQRER